MENPGGDGIETGIGGGAKNTNVGKNNKQEITENNADNNVVINFPMPTWANLPVAPEYKTHSGLSDRRQIPLELEREFRQNLASLNETLIKLAGTVELNNQLTEINIGLLKEQVGQARSLAEKTQEMVSKGLAGVNLVMPDKQPPSWFWPIMTLFGAIALVLLALIAWKLTMGGA